jgi:GNAT superfamily N-acetyltransferase
VRVSSVEVTPVSVRDPAARECLDRYFDELAARFPEGYDRQGDGAAELDGFTPPAGVFLLAQIAGQSVGCGALRTFAPGMGEIKRMWVSPQFRGQGVAHRLLEGLEDAARERGLWVVRLDTHSSLAEALRLYHGCGYREIPRFNGNPYAHHWFEKALDRDRQPAS